MIKSLGDVDDEMLLVIPSLLVILMGDVQDLSRKAGRAHELEKNYCWELYPLFISLGGRIMNDVYCLLYFPTFSK